MRARGGTQPRSKERSKRAPAVHRSGCTLLGLRRATSAEACCYAVGRNISNMLPISA